MDIISTRFEFLGFEPDLKLKKLSRELLTRVLGDSPSDAFHYATVSKTIAGYECVLKVCSRVGTFTASVAEKDPVLAMETLGEKIFEQLRRWRKSRPLLKDAFGFTRNS